MGWRPRLWLRGVCLYVGGSGPLSVRIQHFYIHAVCMYVEVLYPRGAARGAALRGCSCDGNGHAVLRSARQAHKAVVKLAMPCSTTGSCRIRAGQTRQSGRQPELVPILLKLQYIAIRGNKYVIAFEMRTAIRIGFLNAV